MSDDLLFYETVGDLYYHRYLRLRPGKSEAFDTGRDSNSEENRSQFDSWTQNGEAFSDAIHRIIRLDDRCSKAEAEVERLRELLWSAGHAWQDQWAINWEPICAVMTEADAAKRG